MRVFAALVLVLSCTSACVSSRQDINRGLVNPEEIGPVSFAHCYGDDSAFHTIGGIRSREPFSPLNSDGLSYSWKEQTWSQWTDKDGPKPKANFATAQLANEIFVFGGEETGARFTRNLFAYDVKDSAWRELPTDPQIKARYSSYLLTVEDNLVVFGGKTVDQNNNWGTFTPSTLSWKTFGTYTKDRSASTVLAVGSKIFVWGGFENAERTAQGMLLDPVKGTFEELPRSPLSPRSNAKGVVVDGKAFVFGGTTAKGWSTEAAVYDLELKTWGSLPDLPESRTAFELVEAPEGEILIWGGRDTPSHLTQNAMIFDIKAQTWRILALKAGPTARQAHCLGRFEDHFFVYGGLSDTGQGAKLSDELWLIPAREFEKK